jgi:anthranilate synthase/aminodeoxychorismate synthase-like glutamine amidotransferase
MMSLLLLDNHDSFTWNLVELLRGSGKYTVKIVTPEEYRAGSIGGYDRVIFSPGPGLPQEQPAMFNILGETEKLFHETGREIPVFGVCLGIQAMAVHFGGSLFNLPAMIHGQPRKLKMVMAGHPLFNGIPDGCEVGLYHSWAVDPATLPGCLEVLAVSPEGTILALAHQTLPICGVQFHPESIMTPLGKKMMQNWLTD